MYDVAVVGGGIIGGSAARHITAAGLSVAVVAPSEPGDPSSHRGPFGAHYDQTRLAYRIHADEVERALARRSFEKISTLEEHSPAPIYSRSGHLFVAAPGFGANQLQAGASAGIEPSGRSALSRAHPHLSFPDGVTGYLEPAPAGWFSPRHLVAAQLAAAASAGAHLYPSHALRVSDGYPLTVALADGQRIESRSVLVAAGAFTTRPGLLPEPLAFRLKTETVVLAEIDEEEATRLHSVPTLVYELDHPNIADAYTAPPIAYPDGAILLKWGANNITDRWVEDVDEANDWYGTGDSDPCIELYRPAIEATYPGLAVIGWRTQRCVITYTAHGLPYIDTVVPGRLYVAAGGNGRSAKWADALGGLAASLVVNGEWTDPLPADRFAAISSANATGWIRGDLLADRRDTSASEPGGGAQNGLGPAPSTDTVT